MPEKKGVGIIHIKPFSKSKNVAKIILVDDILNLMCWKCKINHLQIIFHHNDVIFIANILYDISVSALSVVNFLYIYKCNLSCRSPLEKNKKRKEICWYFILLEMVDVINSLFLWVISFVPHMRTKSLQFFLTTKYVSTL